MDTNEAITAFGKVVEALKALQEENAKLKRLMELATEDLANDRPICENCKKLETDECEPEADCSCFEWRFADEAKGLIENGNELDFM